MNIKLKNKNLIMLATTFCIVVAGIALYTKNNLSNIDEIKGPFVGIVIYNISKKGTMHQERKIIKKAKNLQECENIGKKLLNTVKIWNGSSRIIICINRKGQHKEFHYVSFSI